MALGFFSKNNPKGKGSSEKGDGSGGSNDRRLIGLFEKGIVLQQDREELLRKGLDEGLELFESFNENRLKLAFEAFSEDMKKALYEVLFFLHVNHQDFEEVNYTAVKVERLYGIKRETEYEATANLYLEGAPHGVQGIGQLSEVFQEECMAYWQEHFNRTPMGSSEEVDEFAPFVSVASLGSIGTVGHKPITSDLDIQVQYELEPFIFDLESWTDEQLGQALKTEISFWMRRIRVKKKISDKALQSAKVKEGLQKMAVGQVQKMYPNLYKYFMTKQDAALMQNINSQQGTQIRQAVLHEMMNLIKRSEGRKYRKKFDPEKEKLLKHRVNLIQDYIEKKFPKAEIYLFVCDNPSYRRGKHGSTLESKEASGSAYEMILTYDVLMPGIQFTPVIPTHFIVPKLINNSASFYERMIDYIRFGTVEMYKEHAREFVNLGATPSLDLEYILEHGGAVYWESFKAASGNLAKALLNLFRIEMLHNPNYLVMIIEMMKSPNILDQFIKPEEPAKPSKDDDEDEEAIYAYGLRPSEILEMEETEPLLLIDPWWTKYKILKIAFAELSYLKEEERKRISKIIDLCFALHVKVSMVFVKPGDTRKFETYRDKFLVDFLNRAFPPGTKQRTFLEHVNIGETKAVIEFEEELKSLFKASLERILEIQKQNDLPDSSNQEEFEIWFHYYQKNFEPPVNMVRRSILHHLKVPRLRLQTRFDGEKKVWVFRSLQTESKLGKRFDTFGTLDHLPDEIDLLDSPSFLYGLASSILNSYYGYVNQGSLKERKTVIEFDSASMHYGDRSDRDFAYVRPDNVERIVTKITSSFPNKTYHYMDCVSKPKYVTEILVFMHLMKFGQIAFLYRDNLTNWYLQEFPLPELKKGTETLYKDYQKTFKSKVFIQTIAHFFLNNDVSLHDEETVLECWFNPNAADTTHAVQKVVAKEEDLSNDLKTAIREVFEHYVADKIEESRTAQKESEDSEDNDS